MKSRAISMSNQDGEKGVLSCNRRQRFRANGNRSCQDMSHHVRFGKYGLGLDVVDEAWICGVASRSARVLARCPPRKEYSPLFEEEGSPEPSVIGRRQCRIRPRRPRMICLGVGRGKERSVAPIA